MSQRINEADFHAFIDGELDELSTRRIGVAIDAEPVLRQRAELYRGDRDMLRRAYAPLVEEELPDSLVRFVKEHAAVRELVWSRPVVVGALRRPAWQWAAGAGFAAAAALLLAVSWGQPSDRLLAEAIAVRDGDVAAEREVVTTTAALARDALGTHILPASVGVPDLSQEGYTLAETGIYPEGKTGHAVQLDYRNGQGQRLTVYLRQPTGTERYEILPDKNGDHVCIWETQSISAVMVGQMSTEQMLRVAQKAYHALDL
jgi:anti-sigma factor RsiW